MTPKEKANELYFTFLKVLPDVVEIDKDTLKQCALIAVNEIIESRKEDKGFNDRLLSDASEYWSAHPMYLTYWEQVKKEIESL